jgi:lipoprotein
LRAFASKLSAEFLVALAADDASILYNIFATFSVSCHVVKLRTIRLLAPVPIIGNETIRTAHVATLKSCGEFLFPEVLPASSAGATGRHCFLLIPLFFCDLRAGTW